MDAPFRKDETITFCQQEWVVVDISDAPILDEVFLLTIRHIGTNAETQVLSDDERLEPTAFTQMKRKRAEGNGMLPWATEADMQSAARAVRKVTVEFAQEISEMIPGSDQEHENQIL